MNTRILAIFSVIIISLLTTSYAYACIYHPLHNLDNLNIEFTQVKTFDNEQKQNLATIHALISIDRHTIYVQISNAYPEYQAQIKYLIKNTGNMPIQFSAPTIVNPNPEAIQITTDSQNQILQPYQTLQGTTAILILPDAQQNQQYSFQIKNTASPKSPSNPQTSNYWKQQLQTCLYNPNQATIDPILLKQYLIQISQQSNIYQFKGTQTQMFQQALSLLSPSKHTSQTDLKEQLLTLWLNQQAGYADDYKIDGKTSKQIIQASENVLQNQQINRYNACINQCEKFNNL
ncbi:MAG: hypothetical protein ACQCN5_04985 [Candidatus Bathyarchaeia archaeon]|jgi:hypothetical protein